MPEPSEPNPPGTRPPGWSDLGTSAPASGPEGNDVMFRKATTTTSETF